MESLINYAVAISRIPSDVSNLIQSFFNFYNGVYELNEFWGKTVLVPTIKLDAMKAIHEKLLTKLNELLELAPITDDIRRNVKVLLELLMITYARSSHLWGQIEKNTFKNGADIGREIQSKIMEIILRTCEKDYTLVGLNDEHFIQKLADFIFTEKGFRENGEDGLKLLRYVGFSKKVIEVC